MHINTVIIGAGGHARVVLDAVKSQFPQKKIILCDDNAALNKTSLDGSEITTPIFPLIAADEYHIAIGDNTTRFHLMQTLLEKNKTLLTIIHPNTTIAHSSHVATGCFIAAQAVIAPGAFVAPICIINHSAIIDHDCHIDVASHIAPNATLGGGVKIGQQCLIGSGAIILPGIHIGDFVTVGSGAVVTRDIEANSVVTGIPARKAVPSAINN